MQTKPARSTTAPADESAPAGNGASQAGDGPEPRPSASSGAAAKLKRPSMPREVVRNLRRRKLRSFLTLSGIALGAFALTVMGSLAENFNISTGSLRDFLEGQVIVRPQGSNPFFSQGHVPIGILNDIDKVEGVEVAVPRSAVNFTETDQFRFGPPDLIYGVEIERGLRSPLNEIKLADGRALRPGDRWKIVLGSELTASAEVDGRPARVGDTVTLRGHEWEVVGVQAATGTPVDRFSAANIDDVRIIQKELEPFLDVEAIADEIMVFPKDGVDPEDLADKLKPVLGSAEAYPPSATGAQIGQLTAIWNSIILGSALVALLVGGVAIINTMIFSVTERTREIGTKKAIGASSRDILREFLAESAILSFAGGVLGAGVGWLFVGLLNAATRGEGVVSFTITGRLVAFVFLMSLFIGAGAGLLPARRAARIDPVRALRTLG